MATDPLKTDPNAGAPPAPVLFGDAPTAVTPAPTKNTVEDRLAGLLSKDSSYLTRARSRAKGEANKRGLLNSSLAVSAGEAAAIDAALPIARQDSQQAHNLQFQQAGIEGQSLLLGKDIAGNLAAQTQAEGERRGLLTTQIEGSLAAQTQGEANKLAMQATDITSKELLANLEIQSKDRNFVASVATVINNTYTSALNAINSNPNIPAAERAAQLDNIQRQQQAYIKLVETLQNVDLDFPGATGGLLSTPGSTPTTAVPVAPDGTPVVLPDGTGTPLPNGTVSPAPATSEAVQQIVAGAGNTAPLSAAVAEAATGVSVTNAFGVSVTGTDIANAAVGLGFSAALSALGVSSIVGLGVNALSFAITGKSIGTNIAEALGITDPQGVPDQDTVDAIDALDPMDAEGTGVGADPGESTAGPGDTGGGQDVGGGEEADTGPGDTGGGQDVGGGEEADTGGDGGDPGDEGDSGGPGGGGAE